MTDNDKKNVQEDWQSELLHEENLFQVYRLSLGVFHSRFNKTIITLVVIFDALLANQLDKNLYTRTDYMFLFDIINELSSSLLIFAVSLLGFLIAGFSIFTAISKPQLFIVLAKMPSKHKSNHSELKVIFANFINVFVHFTAFLAFVLACIFFSKVVQEYNPELANSIFILNTGVLIICSLVPWSAILILKIKSFIWNIYQVLVLSVAFASISDDVTVD